MIHVMKGYALPPGSDAQSEYGGFNGWVQADASLYNNAVSPVGPVPALNGYGHYNGTEEVLQMNGTEEILRMNGFPAGNYLQSMQLNGFPASNYLQSMQLNGFDIGSLGRTPWIAGGAALGFLAGKKLKQKPVVAAAIGAAAGFAAFALWPTFFPAGINPAGTYGPNPGGKAIVGGLVGIPPNVSVNGYPASNYLQSMQLNGYGGPEEVLDISDDDTHEALLSTEMARETADTSSWVKGAVVAGVLYWLFK